MKLSGNFVKTKSVFFLRNELKEHNKQLVEAAQQAGGATAIDFAIFQNHGYRGAVWWIRSESYSSAEGG